VRACQPLLRGYRRPSGCPSIGSMECPWLLLGVPDDFAACGFGNCQEVLAADAQGSPSAPRITILCEHEVDGRVVLTEGAAQS
jgi:hypothetical protein